MSRFATHVVAAFAALLITSVSVAEVTRTPADRNFEPEAHSASALI